MSAKLHGRVGLPAASVVGSGSRAWKVETPRRWSGSRGLLADERVRRDEVGLLGRHRDRIQIGRAAQEARAVQDHLMEAVATCGAYALVAIDVRARGIAGAWRRRTCHACNIADTGCRKTSGHGSRRSASPPRTGSAATSLTQNVQRSLCARGSRTPIAVSITDNRVSITDICVSISESYL